MSSIVLILGAGPRIGAAVAERFSINGFKVALASRSGSDARDEKGFLSLKADFSQPGTIPSLFEAVEREFNSPPNVVVYNAGSLTNPPVRDDPLSIAVPDVQKDFVVNTVAPYVAAHEAVKAWSKLPQEVKKTFIYTGNITNVSIIPWPLMVNAGMGKAATAYWIGTVSAAYKDRGYQFHYADERHANGRLKGMDLDGDAHGDFYAQLAAHEGSVPWHATFVKGSGYTKF